MGITSVENSEHIWIITCHHNRKKRKKTWLWSWLMHLVIHYMFCSCPCDLKLMSWICFPCFCFSLWQPTNSRATELANFAVLLGQEDGCKARWICTVTRKEPEIAMNTTFALCFPSCLWVKPNIFDVYGCKNHICICAYIYLHRLSLQIPPIAGGSYHHIACSCTASKYFKHVATKTRIVGWRNSQCLLNTPKVHPPRRLDEGWMKGTSAAAYFWPWETLRMGNPAGFPESPSDEICRFLVKWNLLVCRRTSSGWWFGCHQFYFPIDIGNLIIPIDDLICFRGVAQPPTSSWLLFGSEAEPIQNRRVLSVANHLRLDCSTWSMVILGFKQWWVTPQFDGFTSQHRDWSHTNSMLYEDKYGDSYDRSGVWPKKMEMQHGTEEYTEKPHFHRMEV